MFLGGHKVAQILYIGLPIVTMVKPYSYQGCRAPRPKVQGCLGAAAPQRTAVRGAALLPGEIPGVRGAKPLRQRYIHHGKRCVFTMVTIGGPIYNILAIL